MSEFVPSAASATAVIYQGSYPDKDGFTAGNRRVRDLAQGIASTGVRTWFLTPSHFELGETTGKDLFECVHLGVQQTRPTLASRRAFWRDTQRFVNSTDIKSVLFYNTTFDSYATLRNFKKSGRSVAYEMCDMFSTMNWKPWKKLLYKLAETYLPKQTTLNVTISSGIERWLQLAAPKTPTLIVPGLYDSDEFVLNKSLGDEFRSRFNITPSNCLFMYSGSWFRIKGLKTLLMSFANLVKQYPECRLLITGRKTNPRFDEDVPQLVSELGIDSSVVLTGFLDNQQLAGALSGADVVVCPHESHRFADFAFPTKVAEYAGMGKAIISTDVGDVSRYLENEVSVLLCPPGDVAALTKKMELLYSDPVLRIELSENAKRAADMHFDYRANGKRLVQLLHRNQQTSLQ